MSERLSPEGNALVPDLPVQLEVGHEVNVLDPIVRGDRDRVPLGLQELHPGLPELLHCYGEVKAQVLYVSLVRLEIVQEIMRC